MKIEACLADSAATSAAFNKLLSAERLKIANESELAVLKELQLKDCFVHASNNISKDTIEALSNTCNEFVSKIKNIAKVMNLKNAAYHPISADFRNFQTEKEISHPKSIGDLAGHRFMFLSDLAWQILQLKDLLFQFVQKYPEAYTDAKMIHDYITDKNFLYQLEVCVLIHAACIEPLKHISTCKSIVARDHLTFKDVLYQIFEYLEFEDINKTSFLNLVPQKFQFAFNTDKLNLLTANLKKDVNIFQTVLAAAKDSMLKRYIDRPVDDVYSFHSNVNVERVFAMAKRNEDMAPHKEIYTRCQQVKARQNKCIHFLFDILQFHLTKQDMENGVKIMKKAFQENKKWNAEERIKRLEEMESKQQAKKRRTESKVLFLNLIDMDEPMELFNLLHELPYVDVQNNRIKILKKQINILRGLNYKYHGEKVWQTTNLDLESQLKEKLKNLHSYVDL